MREQQPRPTPSGDMTNSPIVGGDLLHALDAAFGGTPLDNGDFTASGTSSAS